MLAYEAEVRTLCIINKHSNDHHLPDLFVHTVVDVFFRNLNHPEWNLELSIPRQH